MLNLTQQMMLRAIGEAFLYGIIFGVIYDVVRFLRILFCATEFREGDREFLALRIYRAAITAFFDVILCLCYATLAIILCCQRANGEIRISLCLIILAGGLLYRLSVSQLTARPSRFIARVIKRVASVPVRIIFRVIRLIISAYHLTIGKIIGKIIKRISYRRSAKGKAVGDPEKGEEGQNYGGERNARARRIDFGYGRFE